MYRSMIVHTMIRQKESKSSMLKCWALSPNWSVANKTNSGIGHGCQGVKYQRASTWLSWKAGNRALKTTYLKTRKKENKRYKKDTFCLQLLTKNAHKQHLKNQFKKIAIIKQFYLLLYFNQIRSLSTVSICDFEPPCLLKIK